MKFVIKIAFSLALLAAFAARSDAAIVNGDFETGNLTGWTTNGGFIGVQDGIGTGGSFGAYAGTIGSPGTFSQTVATSAGQSYSLSLFLFSSGDTPNSFEVFWNGASLGQLIDIPDGPYINYLYNVVGTGSDELVIAIRNDPWFQYLDDVSLTETSATPEPATLAIWGGISALGLIAGYRRKKALATA